MVASRKRQTWWISCIPSCWTMTDISTFICNSCTWLNWYAQAESRRRFSLLRINSAKLANQMIIYCASWNVHWHCWLSTNHTRVRSAIFYIQHTGRKWVFVIFCRPYKFNLDYCTVFTDCKWIERRYIKNGAQRIYQPSAEQSVEDDIMGSGRVGQEKSEISQDDRSR